MVYLRIVEAAGSFVKDSVMVAGFGGRSAILPVSSYLGEKAQVLVNTALTSLLLCFGAVGTLFAP